MYSRIIVLSRPTVDTKYPRAQKCHQSRDTGYPQLRFVGLLKRYARLVRVAMGGYKDAEVILAHEAVQYLKPGMLCLADRGFPGYPLWMAASRTGAQLLWRIPQSILVLTHKTSYANDIIQKRSFFGDRDGQQESVLFEAENISENYLLKVTLLKAIVKLSFRRERKVK
jgi:hypothetical protein